MVSYQAKEGEDGAVDAGMLIDSRFCQFDCNM